MSKRTRALGAVLTGLLILAGAGCGSDDSSADSSGAASAAKYPDAAKLLPAELRDKGTLVAAMADNFPPEHFREGGKLTGFNPDFSQALAEGLGLKVELAGINFEAIIPGLQAKRYDVGIAAVFITDERQKVVDFVSYFNEGSSLVVDAEKSLGINSIADVCGYRAALEKGTAHVSEIEEQSAKCEASGKKPVRLQMYAKQSEASLALTSGQADFLAFTTPAATWAAKSNPRFRVVEQYTSYPAGIVVPKGEGDLARAIQLAVQEMIKDGSYQTILEKWGMQAGAITDPQILPNP